MPAVMSVYAVDEIPELSGFQRIRNYGRKILGGEPLDNPISTTYGYGDLEGEGHDFDNIPDMAGHLAGTISSRKYNFFKIPTEILGKSGSHNRKRRELSTDEKFNTFKELRKNRIHTELGHL